MHRFQSMTPQSRLETGLEALDISLSSEAQEKLLHFVQMMIKWNRVYNLTSVRKPEDIIIRHILDSLTVVPYLNAKSVLDVGTGAGLPGIPLAFACPDTEFILLDSNNKKVRFVRQALGELELANVEAIQARVEEYKTDAPFDVVISRAYSSVQEMFEQAGRLLAPGGHLMAMKGVYPLAEMEALDGAMPAPEVVRLNVPGLDAERHLVMLASAQD